MPGVADVMRVSAPYKLVSRQHHPRDDHRLGRPAAGADRAGHVHPDRRAVRGRDARADARGRARWPQAAGATLLRGGAYKPRTSPYAFQGLGEAGLRILADVREETGLPVVTEVVDAHDVDLVASVRRHAAGRHPQHGRTSALLQAVGEAGKPVMLKRGMSATIEEWLMAAEYIAQRGNLDIVLCERGIRTFETATRNTLDISRGAGRARRCRTCRSIVDPSHSGGRRDLVVPLSRAAIAVGADGIIVDVHPQPRARRCATARRRWSTTTCGRSPPRCASCRRCSAAGRLTPLVSSDASTVAAPVDVVVVDVEVGHQPQVPRVEHADQHALLLALLRQPGGVGRR